MGTRRSALQILFVLLFLGAGGWSLHQHSGNAAPPKMSETIIDPALLGDPTFLGDEQYHQSLEERIIARSHAATALLEAYQKDNDERFGNALAVLLETAPYLLLYPPSGMPTPAMRQFAEEHHIDPLSAWR